jgi:hypothetical protein
MSLDTVLGPLAADSCRLMPAELVARFNELAEVARTVRDGVPRLARLLDELAPDLAALRQRLTRERFPVGFLGRTQIGKSTTLNNILGVADDVNRRPSDQGNGDSTTSVITRVRGRDSGPESIRLFYLSEPRFRFKRDKMCESVSIDPSLDDEKVLALLPEQEQRIAQGRLTAMSEDPRYLRRLLSSYLSHRGLVGSAPQAGKYADRFKYLNHKPADTAPSPYLLLEEALIHFQTDVIHPELELIDLPGLGAHVSIDTITSRERLLELDGALVFLSVKARTDEVAEKVFAKLREAYRGDFVGRVWLVLTNFDTLGTDFLHGSQGSNENGFDGIARLADRHRVPLEQVYLVSNYLPRTVARDANGKLDRRAAAAAVGFQPDEIPPGLDRHPGLLTAYHAIFEDGGLGRLRALLREGLLPIVHKRTQDWITQRLCEVCKRLRGPLELARSRSRDDLLPDVNKCLAVVHAQLSALSGRTTLFEPHATTLRDELLRQFEERFGPGEYNDARPLDKVRKRFRSDAEALQSSLSSSFRDVARSVFTGVGGAFQGLPELPVLNSASVAEAWQALAEADAGQPEASWCAGRFPGFYDEGLFEGLHPDETDGLNGKWYRELVQHKARASVQQALHLLRWRLVARLAEVDQALNDLTQIGDEAAGAARVDYDGLLGKLRSVCPST